MRDITTILLENCDEKYRNFSKKLIPDTKLPIIGVRTPIIKQIAKGVAKNEKEILKFISNEHKYYEEFLLHGILLNSVSENIDETLKFVEAFIPYIDNWAVCDSTVAALKLFKKNRQIVLEKVENWIKSPHPYTVRFAIVTLLNYFLGENFDTDILTLVKSACCEHYYINMAIAWFYSIALVKNYDDTIKLIKEKSLPKFIQNKSIQKAIDSYRISEDKKIYLKTLKI